MDSLRYIHSSVRVIHKPMVDGMAMLREVLRAQDARMLGRRVAVVDDYRKACCERIGIPFRIGPGRLRVGCTKSAVTCGVTSHGKSPGEAGMRVHPLDQY